MGLSFLGLGTPAVLSANRLMGEICGNWLGGTTGNGCADEFVKAVGLDDAGDDWEMGGGGGG